MSKILAVLAAALVVALSAPAGATGDRCPPDVDPASLVGQWVLALQIEEGT